MNKLFLAKISYFFAQDKILSNKLVISQLNFLKLLKMGKGDKKTRRGKIFMGSYGVSRPSKESKPEVVKAEPKKTSKKK